MRLQWQGNFISYTIHPKLYVLSIGVSDYKNNELDLNYAAKDAEDFSDTIKAQKKGLYRAIEVNELINPSKNDILDGLDWLEQQVTSKDIAMLYFSGHGVNDHNGNYYFLPAPVNLDKLRRTAVSYHDIKTAIVNLPGKTLAFIDTCHAGNIMGNTRGVKADINAVINDVTSAENGIVVFSSSTGRQDSIEDSKWENGAFTEALIEGLTGKADYTNDGTITINQLDLYLSEWVKELTNNKQTPVTTKPKTIADYPLVVVR